MVPRTPKAKRVLFVTDFYQEEILEGIVDHAGQAGWDLIANMRFHGEFPGEREADGILMIATGERVRKWVRGWDGTPRVNMGEPIQDLDCPSIGVNYAEAARAGARHLLELGHVNFAFYSLVAYGEGLDMRGTFAEELAQSGLSMKLIDFSAVHGDAALHVPREERLQWLARELLAQKKPLAVMADDDRRSLELMAACDLAGLRVPEDVAIVGCENRSLEVRLSRVPLSSVDMNWRRVGREAAILLDRIMAGEGTSIHHLKVPTRGVVGRASTATFVTESQGISRALLYVREHFPQPMKMTDLSKMAGMSERQFRSEFKRLVGRSPRSEIHRARLSSATRLLRDTDLKLDAIAAESGFGSAKKLCEVFAETHGMTPTGWRQKARGD